eukprot:TRINITY_DN928_c0_g1_i1.p1 TRINITY_DN928_c0_g1~~TRINITY_DN928_c0_g1_i1.p1  ORF type:complete len:416 (-),score=170.21 TRINITY_DN928_c0_g1_i1:99-1346(-)
MLAFRFAPRGISHTPITRRSFATSATKEVKDVKEVKEVPTAAAGNKKKDKFTIGKDGKIKVEFGVNPYKSYKMDAPAPVATTSKEELLKFFRDMTLWRRVEIAADNLYKAKHVRGFLHLYNGQEAIVAGYEAALTKDDHVITAYRDHANFMGRGGSPFEVISELIGKAGGCSAGKGGSMHFYKRDANFHGGNGIVGAQVPIGAGVAFALKYQQKPNVCIAMYGDGAANQGQNYEAFNMAALWKLPVIFVCENNKYGMGTSAERSSANTEYYTRGDAVPGIKIDAMNVLSVKAGFEYAKQHALTKGPLIVEAETYRYMGHSMSDPGLAYRTRDEVAAIKADRDPIDKVKFYLLENKLSTEEELKEIEKEIKKEVDEAQKKAMEGDWPEIKELYNNVYTEKGYYVRHTNLEDSVVVE